MHHCELIISYTDAPTMNITDTSELRVSRAFSTPIGISRIKNHELLNQQLKTIILEEELTSASTRRSNIGGWRSRPDLLDIKHNSIATLLEHIQRAIQDMLKATKINEEFTGRMKISGWANVLRSGNYNTPHNHPESVWSGVYYVDAGSKADSGSLSGLLELLDPRPQVSMVPAPGFPFGTPMRIQPEDGLMVVFPSWLYHHVHPYNGDNARIAIAFNVPMLATISMQPE